VTQEAKAENRSVYVIHEDSSTVLTQQSREKCIFRDALNPVDKDKQTQPDHVNKVPIPGNSFKGKMVVH